MVVVMIGQVLEEEEEEEGKRRRPITVTSRFAGGRLNTLRLGLYP
jgi:hypothetical protein